MATKTPGPRKVAYFYDDEIGNYHYGCVATISLHSPIIFFSRLFSCPTCSLLHSFSLSPVLCHFFFPMFSFPSRYGHPMKPHRVRMAHSLVVTYGLNEQLDIYRPRMVTQEEMTQFHTDDYVHFLRNTTPDNMHEFLTQLQRFNVGEDCPLFDGLYDYCQLYTSGSVGGAVRLNNDQNDIVINWSGGLHHAKKGEASGFCYINDCVLCILELLKKYPRVLYIDIDIHHGDGVEEAFYTSDRVMTFSLHKYGDYFPGTGDVSDLGYGKGKGYAINFPLHDGMDDEAFVSIFRPIITSIMENFKPGAVCLQCGADSLAGDRLGCFNLSLRGEFCFGYMYYMYLVIILFYYIFFKNYFADKFVCLLCHLVLLLLLLLLLLPLPPSLFLFLLFLSLSLSLSLSAQAMEIVCDLSKVLDFQLLLLVAEVTQFAMSRDVGHTKLLSFWILPYQMSCQ